jgi:hypothetical protein
VSSPAGSAVAAAVGGALGAAAAGGLDVAELDSGTAMLSYERQELLESALASVYAVGASGADALAGVLSLIPQFEVAAKPAGMGAAVTFGGIQLAAVSGAAGRVLGGLSTWHSFQSTVAQKMAGLVWREQDHAFQCRSAALDIAQLDRQIIAAEIRLVSAELEDTNSHTAAEQSAAVEALLAGKYTDQELYAHLERETAALFFRAYQLAHDLAKQAERCHRFELGVQDSAIIQFGYWDSLRKGLLSGERLGLAQRQLERAHMERDRREHEITRHVSLLELDPEQLVALRTTGSCEFSLPESLFDVDFPGHYFRRVVSVSVSCPCVVGPYTSVNGTLTLLANRLRTSPSAQGDYAEQADGADPRFLRDNVPLQSVATSSAQDASGVFQLDFAGDRYLPFEGAGTVSLWRFELPGVFRQFDYDSIADLVLHVRYTARDGGRQLRDKAVEDLRSRFDGDDTGLVRMFSLRSEFPADWNRYLHTPAGDAADVGLRIDTGRFPYLAARGTVSVTAVGVLATGGELDADSVRLAVVESPTDTERVTAELVRAGSGGSWGTDLDAPLTVRPRREDTWDEWRLSLPAPGPTPPTDVVLVCRYGMQLPD